MASPTLIITSPHAKCDLLHPKRMCDLAAALAGQVMTEEAGKYGLEHFYFPGDVYRHDHDLNRMPSRKTNYRKKVLKQIEKLSGTNAILLDIHSFPNYYMDEAGDINFFRKGETPPEIVLIRGPLDTYRNKRLANLLHSALSRRKVRVKILEGISVNDILNQTSEHNIPGILIEYNESFNKNPNSLLQICRIIINEIIKTDL